MRHPRWSQFVQVYCSHCERAVNYWSFHLVAEFQSFPICFNFKQATTKRCMHLLLRGLGLIVRYCCCIQSPAKWNAEKWKRWQYSLWYRELNKEKVTFYWNSEGIDRVEKYHENGNPIFIEKWTVSHQNTHKKESKQAHSHP